MAWVSELSHRRFLNKRTEEKRRTVTETGAAVPQQTLSVPLADLGVPIPYLVGRQRILSPNTIWYGNVRPIVKVTRAVSRETETVTEPAEGIGGGTNDYEVTEEVVTVTYETIGYHLSMQFSLCLGPGVVLKKIGVGEQVIWQGTAGPGRTEFVIGKNDSYVAGAAIFSGGAFDQAPDPYLAGFIDPALLPGYVGVANIILKDVRADQIRGAPWFEVERFPNPLGLSAGENRLGDDLNVASAIADYLASDWGGAGVGLAVLGTASFTASAQRLASEGNGCSLQLNQENDSTQVLSILQDQADGLIFEDPSSGTIELRLVRFDQLNPVTAHRLNENNVTRVTRWNRNSWVGTFNKMRLLYTSRADAYKEKSIIGYNFSAINDQIKASRPVPMSFPAVNDRALAIKLLGRELSRRGQPTVTAELEANREPANALPGDAVQVFLPERGVPPMLGVASRVQRFPLGDNRTIVGVVEVPRQDADISFDAEDGLGQSIVIGARQPMAARILQAPYFLARRRGINVPEASVNSFILPLLLPSPADNLQDTFSAYIANKPGAQGVVAVTRYAPYPTVGSLGTAIGAFDAMDGGTIATLALNDVVNPKFLVTEGIQGVREGRVLLLVENEIMSFEAASDAGGGSWTLSNVHRALLDTAPQQHDPGAAVHVIGTQAGTVGENPITHPVSYTPAWRITSNTAFFETDPEDDHFSTSTWSTADNRLRAPLRPHDARIDGAPRSDSLSNELGEVGQIVVRGATMNVTWRTRSRAALGVALQLDAAQPGEVDDNGNYQRHRVLIRDAGNALRDAGLTGNDLSHDQIMATVPIATALGRGDLFVRAETIYGQSLYEDRIPVFVLESAYFVNEGGTDFYTSEDGQSLYVAQ